MTNNPLKNSSSNEASPPPKRTKVYNLTDSKSELQKNVTHDQLEKNLSNETLSPSKSSKVYLLFFYIKISNMTPK